MRRCDGRIVLYAIKNTRGGGAPAPYTIRQGISHRLTRNAAIPPIASHCIDSLLTDFPYVLAVLFSASLSIISLPRTNFSKGGGAGTL